MIDRLRNKLFGAARQRLTQAPGAIPTTCNLAADLTSGEAKAVTGTGTTERWYKYVATADGTVTIAITNSTGA